MRSFFSRMNPTLRGFLIILAIVAVVVGLWLEASLAVLVVVVRIAFLLAIADLAVNWYGGARGLQVIAFVGVLVLSGVAMWRTWRDQHHYAS
jgi:energy-coupling factor transporter transmembrane protein EcfT